MIQTYEAVIDANGKVILLDDVRLEKNHRALVTVLEEESKARSYSDSLKLSTEEIAQAKARLARFAGAVKSGNPHSSDNESIDADLVSEDTFCIVAESDDNIA
jgi:D-serine dehydratase